MITTATAKRPHICQLAPGRVLMARSSKSETDTTLIVVKVSLLDFETQDYTKLIS